ncbi:hypothetical protein D3C71_1444970 [compost metagenome]
MHCCATCSAVYSPPGWYQRPIQLSAPAITKAVILGSQGWIEPSATPSATRRRNSWSMADLRRRSSLRLSGGTCSSPTRIRHMPKSMVTMRAYTCMQVMSWSMALPPAARDASMPSSIIARPLPTHCNRISSLFFT